VARRLVSLAALLCMIVHAGLVAVHHLVPGDRLAAETRTSSIEPRSTDLAQALAASMCRPAGLSADGERPKAPSEPSGQGAPCLICCCPAAATMLPPLPVPCPHPGLGLLPERIAWQARQILTRARISERPPVRAPPTAA